MENTWTKVGVREDDSKIPPLPTREQEIEYLEKLEKDLRERPYSKKRIPPSPARAVREKLMDQDVPYESAQRRKVFFYSVIFSPLAFYLAQKSPAKACPMGIPYRLYPYQHKVRFFTFFALYELLLVYGFYYSRLINDPYIKESDYPIHQLRDRKL